MALENISAKFFNKVKNQLVCARLVGTSSSNVSWKEAKPYESIPGPKPLPIPYYGNFWRFLSIGNFNKLDLVKLHNRWYEKYGPVVRLTGKGPEDIIFLYDPDYFETVFRNEGDFPARDMIDSLRYYREVLRKDVYGEASLSTAQGEVWQKNRKFLNQHMMSPTNTMTYAMPINEIADQLVERIKSLRDAQSEMPAEFINELSIYTVEAMGVIALGTRLGAYETRTESKNSRAADLVKASEDLTKLMFELDYTPSLWHFINTPTWKKFVKKNEDMLSISKQVVGASLEIVKEKMKDKNYKPVGVLENLYAKENNPKMAWVMANDLLSAGVETVSESLAHTMYYISRNPEKQEKLLKELKSLLPRKDTPIDPKIFNELRYLKGCIKESHRMAPVVHTNQRRTAKDLVLGGYQVPKGSVILAANVVPCSNEKYFKNAQQFIPERWLKSSNDSEKSFIHPFAFMPFGYGIRSCIGRRFSELQTELALAKIFRNFKVQFNHGDMVYESGFVLKCAKPLHFKIEDRPE